MPTPEPLPLTDSAGFEDAPAVPDAAVARRWWDAEARNYLAEHGDFLEGFRWCPEGLTEQDAGLLGDVRDRVVLEVGAGAAQSSAWLRRRGARALATDVSAGMLRAAGPHAPSRVQADARALPVASVSVDVAFSAFGALQFVPDPAAVHAEVARVLRPGGRWVFAVTHPLRWAFPDDPEGLTAVRSYFDRRPYVERAADGTVLYAEHHRTLGDVVADVTGSGLVLDRLVEPEWPAGATRTWGGWGPVRGALLPGTAIVVTHRP